MKERPATTNCDGTCKDKRLCDGSQAAADDPQTNESMQPLETAMMEEPLFVHIGDCKRTWKEALDNLRWELNLVAELRHGKDHVESQHTQLQHLDQNAATKVQGCFRSSPQS